MKTTSLILMIAALLPAVAFAADTKPAPKSIEVSITYPDISLIRDSLVKLDGYTALDADKKSITVPYQLPGHVRLAIADDMQTVATILQTYQQIGQTLLKQVGGGEGKKLTDAQTAQLNALWADAIAVKKTLIFETISDKDLDLDNNPIPSTILAILKPLRVP